MYIQIFQHKVGHLQHIPQSDPRLILNYCASRFPAPRRYCFVLFNKLNFIEIGLNSRKIVVDSSFVVDSHRTDLCSAISSKNINNFIYTSTDLLELIVLTVYEHHPLNYQHAEISGS